MVQNLGLTGQRLACSGGLLWLGTCVGKVLKFRRSLCRLVLDVLHDRALVKSALGWTCKLFCVAAATGSLLADDKHESRKDERTDLTIAHSVLEVLCCWMILDGIHRRLSVCRMRSVTFQVSRELLEH